MYYSGLNTDATTVLHIWSVWGWGKILIFFTIINLKSEPKVRVHFCKC